MAYLPSDSRPISRRNPGFEGRFEHDSSEEKLWSKFSDLILSKSLGYLGLSSKVLRTRGNSADVYSEAKNYTLVSDAKCL